MTNTELKAYIKSKLSFEDEKVLEEVTKRMKKVFENSLFGMTKIESLKKDIEKVVDSSSRGQVKDYFLVLDENKDNLDICEYLIPSVLSKGIKEGYCNVSVIKTNSKWVGVTYKEDKKDVVEYIKNQKRHHRKSFAS